MVEIELAGRSLGGGGAHLRFTRSGRRVHIGIGIWKEVHFRRTVSCISFGDNICEFIRKVIVYCGTPCCGGFTVHFVAVIGYPGHFYEICLNKVNTKQETRCGVMTYVTTFSFFISKNSYETFHTLFRDAFSASPTHASRSASVTRHDPRSSSHCRSRFSRAAPIWCKSSHVSASASYLV